MMVYILEKKTNNGYRCSCCKRTDRDTEYYNDLEVVLRAVPRTYDEVSGRDSEIEELTVIDGSTGEKIVDLSLDCMSGVADRYGAYKGAVWRGYVGDERIESNSGDIPQGMTFEQRQDELRQEYKQRKLREAEALVERAKRELEVLQKIS